MKCTGHYFFALLVLGTTSACKIRTGDSKNKSFEDYRHTLRGKQDIQRINGELESQIIIGDPALWRQFQGGTIEDFPIDYQSYLQLWNAYKNFVIDIPNKPLLRKKFRVLLHIHRQKTNSIKNEAIGISAKGIQGVKITETEIANIKNLESTKPHKSCIASKIIENKDAVLTSLTYELQNLRQPNIARNFLILAMMGYFDGKKISAYAGSAGIAAFGSSAPTDPAYFAPDPWYTAPNADASADKYLPDSHGSTRQKSPADLSSAGFKIETVMPFGTLAGLAENTVSLDSGRVVFMRKFGLLFYRGIGESLDNLYKQKNFPVPFAKLLTSRRSMPHLENIILDSIGQGADRTRYDFTISCVEILAPEISPWLIDGHDTPEPD